MAAEKKSASLEQYRIKRREASKLYRQKKRRFDRKNMEGLEILRDRNEVRRFYQNVNKQRNGFVPILSAYNDKRGNLITNQQKSSVEGNSFSPNC